MVWSKVNGWRVIGSWLSVGNGIWPVMWWNYLVYEWNLSNSKALTFTCRYWCAPVLGCFTIPFSYSNKIEGRITRVSNHISILVFWTVVITPICYILWRRAYYPFWKNNGKISDISNSYLFDKHLVCITIQRDISLTLFWNSIIFWNKTVRW